MATVTKWGSERWLDDMLGIDTALADITALADGRYAVAFGSLDQSLSVGVFSQIFSASGTKVGDPESLNTNTSGMQTWAAIAAFTNGTFAVVWPGDVSLEPIWVARVGTNGNRIGDDFPLTEDFTDQGEPDVAVLADGSFVVVYIDGTWNDENSYLPAVQRFTAAGVAQGSPFYVGYDGHGGVGNANDTLAPTITALSNGNYVVTWTQRKQAGTTVYDIRGQVYEADGEAVGTEFTANTTTAGTQDDSAVTALAAGSFVVGWGSEGSVRFQRFDAGGVAQGSEVIVSASGSTPSLATLKDGRFVAVWSDGTGGDSNIKGAIYNANGTLSVSPFNVNSATDGFANSPHVTVLADGRFVVEFNVEQSDTDSSVAGNHNGTYMQIFDPRTAVLDIDGSNSLGDQLYGTKFADTFDGLGGADSLWGAANNDTIRGGNGNDVLNGDAGDDSLRGGNDNDTLSGGDGNDALKGEADNDSLRGGNDNDVLTGDDGHDVLKGEAGADSLIGGTSNDTLLGGDGNDTLKGDAGVDTLFGDNNNDTLLAGDGNDTLKGGAGIDRLTGGANDDRYVFAAATDSGIGVGNRDVITDFDLASALERIDLGALSTKTFVWKGTGAFSNTADVEVRYKFEGSTKTIVEVDLDSDSTAEFQIELTGHLVVTKGDFIL